MVDYEAPIAYKDAHRRLRRERGRAADHQCADCPEQAKQWALMHDRPAQQSGMVQVLGRPRPYLLEWSGDPRDFEPLCFKCHARKDEAHRLANGRPTKTAAIRSRRTHCKRDHELTDDNVYVSTNHATGIVNRRCARCERDRKRKAQRAA